MTERLSQNANPTLAAGAPETSGPKQEFFIDSAADYAIVMLDADGIVVGWNPGAERLKGYAAPDAAGKHFSIFYPEDDIAQGKPQRELAIALRDGRCEVDGVRVRKDGVQYRANVLITPAYGAQKQLCGFIEITRNFDERRHILEALRQSEERFRLLVQTVKDYAIFMLLPDGTIASWNEGAERAKGYTASEVIGKHFSIFYTPEDRARGKSQEFLRIAAAQGRVEEEGWRVRKDGTRFWADVVLTALKDDQGQLRGFAKITRDITERKLAEQMIIDKQRQIVELQKVETIGRLAGGIAHDFNNFIAGIMGCAESLGAATASNKELSEDVTEIRKACERAGALTRQLLAFSRKQMASPTVLDMNHEIKELEKMLSRLVGAEIRMEVRLAPQPLPIEMDVSQLQQVAVNLVLNARDAMPQGGRLLIQTGAHTIDELAGIQDFAISSGNYATLAVTDFGTGMTADVQQHIFEPFYTTKSIEKGTGLGLATVYGVVRQNAGAIAVYSAPDFGTTFKVFMPIHSERSDAPEPTPRAEEPAKRVGGTETILVADSDETVLRNTVNALRGCGYTVLSALNSNEALSLAQKIKDRIDLFITDALMPNLNGKELSAEIRQLAPGLPVILMSGFPADLLAERGVLKEGLAFLEKPFHRLAVSEKVRSVLDSCRPRAAQT